jgi:hypothetical protein
MATALNLTVRLKQDEQTLATLKGLKDTFAERVQPMMDAALAESERVHFARVLVIEDKYLQVLTEFDGDRYEYTTFFLTKLGPVFKVIFELVEDAPPWAELKEENAFYEYTSSKNLPSLGKAAGDEPERGYLFSAVGEATVEEIKAALDGAQPAVGAT